MAQRREIDWATATVSDGALLVELTGTSSKRWSARAEGVLVQLPQPGGGWEGVTVKKDRIVVANVREGAKDELRHFLESVVQEANAAVTEETDDDGHEDDKTTADDRMAERFRAVDDNADDGSDEARE